MQHSGTGLEIESPEGRSIQERVSHIGRLKSPFDDPQRVGSCWQRSRQEVCPVGLADRDGLEEITLPELHARIAHHGASLRVANGPVERDTTLEDGLEDEILPRRDVGAEDQS